MIAVSELRSETPALSRLVAMRPVLAALLEEIRPNLLAEALEEAPVLPASVSPPTKAPALVIKEFPLSIPAVAASADLLSPSPLDSSTRLVFVVAVAPTEWKTSREEPADTSAGSKREPFMLLVSLSDQNIDVYQGSTRITSSRVSSGRPGYETKAGVFSILEKQRYHHSNLYDDAPMPWMQRLTRSGTALHAGVVPGFRLHPVAVLLRAQTVPDDDGG